METGKVINRISNRLRRRSAALQETLGMSGAQGNILNFILVEGQKHSIYQKDIEKEFGLRPSTATEVLKALEKKELICRVSEKQDARLKRIEFTSKAEEIRHLIKGDHFQIVIQIGMHRIRDDQQFLVLWLRIAFHHGSIGIPAEIAGVGLFPMNDQHC